MKSYANNEVSNEMPQKAAFHQGLQYLLRQNQYSDTEKQYIFRKLYPVTPTQ